MVMPTERSFSATEESLRGMYVVLKGEVEVMSHERVVGTICEGQALGVSLVA